MGVAARAGRSTVTLTERQTDQPAMTRAEPRWLHAMRVTMPLDYQDGLTTSPSHSGKE
jgi:hypothetical protein